MHLHLDPVGGVAGDMFIAAMLDAFPKLIDGTLTAIESAGLPSGVSFRLADHKDHALTGRRFIVEGPAVSSPDVASAHNHPHDAHHPPDAAHHLHDDAHHRQDASQRHAHVPFAVVRDNLMNSALADQVKRRAIEIFTLLAQAEAKVHGSTPDEVTFHEVGAWDSIADIVGAAYLIETLHSQYASQGLSWSVAPLPLGSGRVNSAHGLLPVPAPATALLLEGMVVRSDDLEGERITPTGAAILRHLNCRPSIGAQPRRLLLSGTGFGTRSFPGISNILRVMVFEDPAQLSKDTGDERVVQLSFEIDDQSPEDLAIGLERLRGSPGVIDVLQIPSFGKKGRMASQIQVLVQPDNRDLVVAACFAETTTIGIRVLLLDRYVLLREATSVAVGSQLQRVKKVFRPNGVVTAKAEMDDLAQNATNHAERQALRVAAEQVALGKDRSHD